MSDVRDPGSEHSRRAPIVALLVANSISFVGDILAFLAIPWFVLQTTHSVTQTGITAFFTIASVAASAFFGSRVVDWLGYKRASVLSDVISGAGIGLIPLLYVTGTLTFASLLVLVFFVGLVATPGRTARSALIPDLAQMARMRLERATSAADGMSRLSGLIGAPLAGVLIAFTGTNNLL